jgi:hypothetical protein
VKSFYKACFSDLKNNRRVGDFQVATSGGFWVAIGGVTFNGTAAAFTVVSESEIATTVPTGATTGYVEVVTPRGTLTSNVVYTVKP